MSEVAVIISEELDNPSEMIEVFKGLGFEKGASNKKDFACCGNGRYIPEVGYALPMVEMVDSARQTIIDYYQERGEQQGADIVQVKCSRTQVINFIHTEGVYYHGRAD